MKLIDILKTSTTIDPLSIIIDQGLDQVIQSLNEVLNNKDEFKELSLDPTLRDKYLFLTSFVLFFVQSNNIKKYTSEGKVFKESNNNVLQNLINQNYGYISQ